MAISPPFQHRGLGRALVEHAQQLARAAGNGS
jgi:ribosomal protein S18 acetylase RimI-like enzyme